MESPVSCSRHSVLMAIKSAWSILQCLAFNTLFNQYYNSIQTSLSLILLRKSEKRKKIFDEISTVEQH